MKIFVSHISEEALLALLLKDFIESTFLGQGEVLLSSSSGDSGADGKWLSQIEGAFASARLLLLLCSPKSISQPWIHFESGCAWIKNVPILAICHSGLDRTTLPPPLGTFEALDVDEPDFMEQFFASLATRLGVHRLPRLSYDTMKAELRATLVSITPPEHYDEGPIRISAVERDETGTPPPDVSGEPAKDAVTEPEEVKKREPEEVKEREPEKKEPPAPPAPVPKRKEQEEKPEKKKDTKVAKPEPRIAPPVSSPEKDQEKKADKAKDKVKARPESVQTRILRRLSSAEPQGCTLEDLADLVQIIPPKLEPYLDALKEQGYIKVSFPVGSPHEYTIAPKGKKFLTDSKLSE